ncbi:tRNA (N(6)-L-threonylcarbamoyladenosine(37)-C(2))-methylthiotransferase [Candidatus Micrarchaeota archaeon]|nr:tRNA (N(6)-L-threonylcarbamoyladenosine(37)-C(2))-methylthiotransferase [Candidatus Micrarchaeota archaeon]MBU1930756.1 tRNA (N(6)-L-threonylcarbamoyladenosine(37)-C(2))-methylthiotransferase [Candidatus Micrarchaeota archaeon]
MKIWVTGFGCSANLAETEQIKGYLSAQNVQLVSNPRLACRIIIHSCGVKKATEFKIKRRVQELKKANPKAQIIVSGCLPKINFSLLEHESNLIQAGPELESITQHLSLSSNSFSPLLPIKPANHFVSMIPIATGCLSNCSFCGTKKAKGTLQSHSIPTIQSRFEQDVKKGIKEFWLTSQDNGCYGFDLKTNLPQLVNALLSSTENFRIRIGMLSPHYIERYLDDFIELFSDKRIFKFVHLSVQSGNNRILKLMRRAYSVEQFESTVQELRQKIPGLSLSTDIIVGFPTETEKEFLDSVELVKYLQPDVVNIARFGLRPNTLAEQLPDMIDREKTNRSHLLSRVCRNLLLKKNLALIGKKETVLISEKAKHHGFIGRTNSYRPVVVPHAVLGTFSTVHIREAFPHFLKGVLEKEMLNPLLAKPA